MDGTTNKGGVEGLKYSYSRAVKGLNPWEVDVASPEERRAFLDGHYKKKDREDGENYCMKLPI